MNNNEITEEENEIIEVFKQELKVNGYDGYCSFDGNVSNGYFIYKEGRNWVVEFNKKGSITSSKKYTNIYNTCLDILGEMKIDSYRFEKKNLKIPRGTRVIITTKNDCPFDGINMGVIINSSLESRNNSKPERVYQVFGDDDRLYSGIYGLSFYGDTCFRTIEDFIYDKEKEIKDNVETVKSLIEDNIDLYLSLEEIKGEKDRYLGESIMKK